jgi:hypothetical protein
MSVHKSGLETCSTAAPVICIGPFTLTAGRFFGLDAGDWSVVLFGFALGAGLLALL